MTPSPSRRRPLAVVLAVVLAVPAASPAAPSQETVAVEPTTAAPSAGPGGELAPESRQFDFWLGTWDVNLRMMAPDGGWPDSSVRATAWIYPVLDGKAVLELWDSEPIVGFSLRWYDPDPGRWRLWLNWPGPDRSGSSGLEGSFRHGRGEFFSRRPTEEGGERIARYTFSDIAQDRLRWDDAYSTDGGKTWSHAWIMEFSRTGPAPRLPAGGRALPTGGDGDRCSDPRFRRFEPLVGSRLGSVRRPAAAPEAGSQALLEAWSILDGCAVLAQLTLEGEGGEGGVAESLHLLTFNTYAQVFEQSTLDDVPGAPIQVFYGPSDALDSVTLELSGQHGAEPGARRHRWTLSPEEIRLVVEATGDDGRTWTPELEATFPGGDREPPERPVPPPGS